MRKVAASKEHEQLVRIMASHFEKKGYSNIKADLPGYEQPGNIRSGAVEHRPDVTCEKNEGGRRRVILLEAETGDSIEESHTASQWKLFRLAADQWGGEFHIIVPRQCGNSAGRDLAQQRLRELGISADEIWTPCA